MRCGSSAPHRPDGRPGRPRRRGSPHRAQARGEEVFLMQRLDRGTSGVMFFTKKSEMNPRVTRAFEKKQLSKTYLALVEGTATVPQLIDAPLERVGPISFAVGANGKRALTRITPLGSSDRATLLSIRLLTGRTHQIRVHLSSIGHPLVADWLYGTEQQEKRPMLHSWTLEMKHPGGGERLEIRAPVPADFIAEAESLGIGWSGIETK
ncbi:MAG: RluA family pseudouridine synthase [Acidobacteria bacterium]|nr:RluA family pseudouridine synthase [Acidobacteriota bacterium]